MRTPLKYISLIAFLLIGTLLKAQQIDFELTQNSELTVGGNPDVFTVKYTNNTGASLSSQTITIKLPEGIEYLENSLLEVGDYNLTAVNVTNSENLQFSANDLPTGQQIEFSIQYKAECAAIAEQVAGEVFRNEVTVTHSGGSVIQQSDAYNILYASLSITNVSPRSQQINSGETTSRTITIVNGGNGRISSFKITDTHPNGLEWLSNDIGTLSGNELLLSGSDFSAIGNGDNYFDEFESITFTQTLRGTTCTDQTLSSVIEVSWGANGETCQNQTSNAHISVDFQTPNLKVTTNPDIQACFSSSDASLQEIVLENTSQGIARGASLQLFNSSGNGFDATIYAKMDLASFTYQIGDETAQNISPTSSEPTNNYACLGNNSAGKVTLDLPDIPAGEEIRIRWNSYRCCITSCSPQKIMGWAYELDYTDVCETNTYNKTGIGQETNVNYMTFFTETPVDIFNGEPVTYTFTVSSHENNLPQGNGAFYQLVFDLPEGLIWEGNTNDLTFQSGPNTWSASDISFNSTTRKLTANFPLPSPFTIPKSEVSLTLMPSCASGNEGERFTTLNTFYIADVNCPNSCPIPMSCNTTVSSFLHCPTDCSDGGLQFHTFKIERSSFGLADNNQDGLADANGQLDFSKIKTNRVMFGDTLTASFKGMVFTSASHPDWDFGYSETTIPDGDKLTSLGASVTIYDASTNSYFTCDNVAETQNTIGTSRTFKYDFSPSALQGGCPSMAGYKFEQGDSIWVNPQYQVTGNIGGNIREVTVETAFYLSHQASPTQSEDKFQCGIRRARFTLIGYFFNVTGSKFTTIDGCSKVISQNFHLSIGDCCSNYEGGNLFPYEYRNWAHIKTAKTTIPDNYTILDMYLRVKRTRYTNASITETANPISPIVQNGNQLEFDLEQYYKTFGGNINYSDDGFSGTIYIEVAPNCFVPQNTYQDVPWEFTFAKNEILGGGTETLTSASDKIRFKPNTLQLSSQNPRVDGLEKTVTWHAKIASSNKAVDNAWVHIKSPSGGFQIVRVYDAQTGVSFPQVGDIYQLGSFQSEDIMIEASYSACNYDNIVLYAGYECSGYPNTFADFQCGFSTMKLYAEPKPAQTQVRIKGETIGDACSPVVQIEMEIASVQLAIVKSLMVDVQVPNTNKLSFQANSAELLYPLANSYSAVSNPTLQGNVYTFDLEAMNQRLGERGLPGVTDLDSSRLKLRFNMVMESEFRAGDFVLVSTRSQSACGADLPTINLAFDPNIKFEAQDVPGLTTEINNSWSASWADYDNDGFDDLFIPEYDETKPNALYHNNGDGTFTKITSGEIVEALGGGVASSWGDYDNDGDLDLFIANNLKATNYLFENNGDGTFTRVYAGDLVNYGGYCHGASWGDYDNDGYLDLFVADYMPTRFNLLYHNNGDGTFSQVTSGIVVTEAFNSVGGSWSDYDNDGDLDLYVVNANNQNNALYQNDGEGNFSKITTGHLVNDGANSVGASWGDYDNDGDLDLFVANASNQDNFLYQNNGDGTFNRIINSPVTTQGGHSHGSAWADFDNDGDLDLVVSNDQDGVNFFYLNDGAGNFVSFDNPITEDIGNSFGLAWADYDNDGDLDLYVANHSNQPNKLYKNSRGQCNSWSCVKLVGNRSNTYAVGAKVRVKAEIYGKSVWQIREITSQTGGGAGGQGSMKALFGLGDATQIDSIIVEWPSGIKQYLTNQPTNGCIDIVEELGALVCGTVYYDENQNCIQDANEQGIPNVMLEIAPSNKYITTDENGNYQVYLTEGEYVIRQLENDNWTQVCPNNNGNHTVVINNTAQDYCGYNFGNFAGCPNPDLQVSLSTTALRRGFQNTFAITFSNQGAKDATGLQLSVDFDENIVPLSSDIAWDNQNGTIFTWDIDSLKVGEERTIYVTDSVSRVAPLGEVKSVSATLDASEPDCDALDNQFTLADTIVGSFDPNDKQAFFIGSGFGGNLAPNDVILYKIRFQNVGNYYASRVVILDTLSDYLDASTITMQGYSHDYTLKNEDGILRWEFPGIYLPDTITDEPGSHGFVQFTIRVKDNVPHGAQILNTAAIQFDYNDYIITNTVNNIVYNSNAVQGNLLGLGIYPNPARENVTFRVSSKSFESYPAPITDLIIYDATGMQVFSKSGMTQEALSFKRGSLKAGMYIVKARDAFGFMYQEKLILE